jgi:3-oxoacyl-[acyl-carrier protein] reductase
VGVVLPGASATFLEFSARTERELQIDVPYALEGEVSHRSGGTRIVKKQLAVRTMDASRDVVLRGKVATLVNKASRAMPSIGELKDSAMNWGLEGKVALITGASRGIGETTAKLLALCGARVLVNYHRGADDAARVVGEITEAGGEAVAIGADVTRAEDVAALVDGAVSRFGAVDILVNNAVRDFRPIPFAQLTWDEVQKDIDVVAKGAFLCCQRVIPLMLERGGGKIVNISTVAVDDPPLDQTKYVMAKSALVGLTRSLAIELAPRNIQVNMVVPNFVETDLVAHIQEGFRKKIADDTPMGRHASPIDVARAVVFLASSLSSFTTGQKIMVTGGGAPYL